MTATIETTTATKAQAVQGPAQATIEVEAKELVDALKIVKKAINRRSQLPVLTAVLLERTLDGVNVSATNLDIALTVAIPCVSREGCTIVVDHAQLLAAVSAKGGAVRLSSQPKESAHYSTPYVVTVEQDGATLTCQGYDPADYPAIGGDDLTHAATISIPDWERIRDVVLPCTADDDSRPVLEGILFEIADGQFSAGAADGFRMGYHTGKTQWATEGKHTFILPRSSVKALPALGQYVSIYLSEPEDKDSYSLRARFETVALVGKRWYPLTVLSRCIDGHFPDLKRKVPDTYVQETVVPLSVCEAAKKVSRGNNDIVSFLDDGVHASDGNGNESHWPNVEYPEGHQHNFALNARYLCDAKALALDGKLTIRTKGSNSATVIPNGGSFMVVMPIVMD